MVCISRNTFLTAATQSALWHIHTSTILVTSTHLPQLGGQYLSQKHFEALTIHLIPSCPSNTAACINLLKIWVTRKNRHDKIRQPWQIPCIKSNLYVVLFFILIVLLAFIYIVLILSQNTFPKWHYLNKRNIKWCSMVSKAL